jgi:hypothetical protein
MSKLADIAFYLAKNDIWITIIYDKDKDKFYLDLNTIAKSHLHLYEDGILKGRYNYEKQIDLNDDNIEQIAIDLCWEFIHALHGRDYGSYEWFRLCKQFNINTNE